MTKPNLTPERELRDLEFNLDRSCRYHARRRQFFDAWHRLTMFLVIILGSAAFSDVLGFIDSQVVYVPKLLAFGSVILAAFDLVVGFSLRARDHALLYMRFMDLSIEIKKMGAEAAVQQIGALTAKRYEIEKDEPPVYHALNFACFNEVIVARGRGTQHKVPLSLLHRLFMHYWRFSGMDTRSEKERATLVPEQGSN